MNTPLPHRVRRLHWQARAPTPEVAFALRSLLRESSDEVLAALDRGLSAHAPDDRVRYLPRIEVRLRLDALPTPADLAAWVSAASGEVLGELVAAQAELNPASPLPAPAREVAIFRRPPAATDAAPAALPVAVALLLDALRHEAPADLAEALASALARVGGTGPLPGMPPDSLSTIELSIRGQVLRLPLARLREVARQLAGELAGRPTGATQPGPAESRGPATAPDLPPHPQRDLSSKLPGDAKPDLAPAAAPRQLATPAPTTPLSMPVVGESRHVQAVLATYLQTGSLDWTLAGLASDASLQMLRDGAVLWARLGTLPACCYPPPLIPRIGVLVRWLTLLPRDSRTAVIAAHHPGEGDAHPVFSTALRSLPENVARDSSDEIHAQALWLAWTIETTHARHSSDAGWRQELRQWLASLLPGTPVGAPWRTLLANIELPAAPAQEPGQALAEGSDEVAPVGSLNGPASPPDAGRTPTPAATLADPSPAADPRAAFAQRLTHTAPAGLVVPAAGLVLLHPYLPRLLDATGLYPAGSRGPLADRFLPRATALLHWLATGREVLHEFELPFVKLLLGRAPDAPLPHRPPCLTDDECAEAGALLDAVLAHWQALRGTRVDGLRSSFLQRRGWIEPRDGAWLLRVEPESFDLLLGRLPWSLGLVRLPWMRQPLFTEWNTP
jgi:hypothetical protein